MLAIADVFNALFYFNSRAGNEVNNSMKFWLFFEHDNAIFAPRK